MPEKTKVYITNYALTDGIKEYPAELTEPGTALVVTKYNTWHFPKGKYFLTLEDAKKDAEKIRLKKIDSLKKQIEKLEKMEF